MLISIAGVSAGVGGVVFLFCIRRVVRETKFSVTNMLPCDAVLETSMYRVHVSSAQLSHSPVWDHVVCAMACADLILQGEQTRMGLCSVLNKKQCFRAEYKLQMAKYMSYRLRREVRESRNRHRLIPLLPVRLSVRVRLPI